MHLCNLCNKIFTRASNLDRQKKGCLKAVAPGAGNQSKVIDQGVISSAADNFVANCLERVPDYSDEENNSSAATSDEDDGQKR